CSSAIRCYSCKDYTASCSKQRDCSYDDACLTLTERGGQTYRQCLKYSDCEYSRLGQMFPQVSVHIICINYIYYICVYYILYIYLLYMYLLYILYMYLLYMYVFIIYIYLCII
uniref:UPAR/Ly6 domain-containing protein n=1 Tax=Gadus morhua TaxID=8049 RepID=A0A8C5BU35_GADMO